jgi:hypothetical protein
MANNEGKRLSVNLNGKSARQLRDLTDRLDVSEAEAVRRAIALLHIVHDESDDSTKLQVVREHDGQTAVETLHFV